MSNFKPGIPEIHPKTFIADGARLIGRVILKEGASVWFNSVLRADLADIVIGEDTNIQDNSVIHVERGMGTILGKGVTVGHAAVLHACTIGDNCLIGMGAIVLDGSVVPRDCLLGAGSVVPPNKSFPEASLLLGTPAKFVRKLSPKEIDGIAINARRYRGYWEDYVRNGISAFRSGPNVR